MDEQIKELIHWIDAVRFLPLPLPNGMTWKQAEKAFWMLEREGYIYYTRVDGKKCYRLLTAAGKQVLNAYERERLDVEWRMPWILKRR